MARAKPTRDRIIDEAMRLFGERGYAGTTIADIEAASGLAGGGGGLYRHFSSKRALLDAGVRRQVESNRGLVGRLDAAPGAPGTPASTAALEEQLRELGHAGLDRLEHERDLNRLIVRDLRQFPDLLATAAELEIRPVQAALAGWMARQDGGDGLDAPAVAAVLAGAIAHYWLLRDVFGEHPSLVSVDRYVDALVQLVSSTLAAATPGTPD